VESGACLAAHEGKRVIFSCFLHKGADGKCYEKGGTGCRYRGTFGVAGKQKPACTIASEQGGKRKPEHPESSPRLFDRGDFDFDFVTFRKGKVLTVVNFERAPASLAGTVHAGFAAFVHFDRNAYEITVY
jgi:hypothetical protein